MGIFDRFFRPAPRTFGFLRDTPDARDQGPEIFKLGDARPTVSLRHPSVVARSQSPNHSCAAFMIAQGIELAYAWKNIVTGDLSARAPYFWGRAAQGRLPDDAGMALRPALGACKKFGIPTEKTCPTSAKLINTAPDWRAHQEARDIGRGIDLYARITPFDLSTIRRTLSAGIPIGAGWACDQAFMDYKGDTVLGPVSSHVIGYHAMLLTGYYTDGTFDLFNQSWLNWGMPGSYARVSGAYVCAGTDMWAFTVR